jgi:hypothetical protein
LVLAPKEEEFWDLTRNRRVPCENLSSEWHSRARESQDPEDIGKDAFDDAAYGLDGLASEAAKKVSL